MKRSQGAIAQLCFTKSTSARAFGLCSRCVTSPSIDALGRCKSATREHSHCGSCLLFLQYGTCGTVRQGFGGCLVGACHLFLHCSCLCPPNVVTTMSSLEPFSDSSDFSMVQRHTLHCTQTATSVAALVRGTASGVLCWDLSRDTWRVSAESNSVSRLPDESFRSAKTAVKHHHRLSPSPLISIRSHDAVTSCAPGLQGGHGRRRRPVRSHLRPQLFSRSATPHCRSHCIAHCIEC